MTSATFRGSAPAVPCNTKSAWRGEEVLSLPLQALPQGDGHGHASNLLVKPGSIKWLKGEELIKGYKVPEAIRFTNRFCSVCGGRGAALRAGNGFHRHPGRFVDSEPRLSSRRRASSGDSRANWSCSGDGLPTWPEYST